MILIKVLSTTNNLGVYHSDMGATNAMYLDKILVTSDRWLNNTTPSSVFTLSNGNYGNTNGNTHVAYCFAEKKVLVNLVATQVMVLPMVHLFIQI